MKKIIIPVVVIIIAVAVFFVVRNSGKKSDDVAFSGTVDVTEVDLAFKIPGRLSEIAYDEGDSVKAGEKVAAIDNSDQKLAADTAKANVAVSQAALNEALAGSRKQEIQSASAGTDRAKAALIQAKDDMDQALADRNRFEYLYKNNGVSKHDFELYDTKYKNSVSAVAQAEAAVKSSEESYSLALEGTRSETIKKAGASVDLAKTSLNTAMQNLKYTELYSPINGKVLSRPMEPGEYVQPGSVVLAVADLDSAWVRGYVSEKDLGRIHLGDTVQIKTDSYPDKTFQGRISYIADEAEFTPKAVQTPEERVNFMYRIKVTLDNRKGVLKPGMPVDGVVIIKK